MSSHIVRAFDEDLQQLMRRVTELGSMAERQIVSAVDALIERGATLAQQVIAGDQGIDRLQRDIEEMSVIIIARRQPFAVDLREIISALRVSNNLERIGNRAKNIGRRTIALHERSLSQTSMRGIACMADLVLKQLRQVLESYTRRDAAGAVMVWLQDERVDAVNNALCAEILACMAQNPENVFACTHLLFCAKNLERIGDHATNIAEIVHYMVHGEPLRQNRPKADNIRLMPA